MPVCKHDISIEDEKVWLCVSYGEVVGQQKWTETHVSGSGNQYGTSVSSTVHEKLEFWIREKDGHEERIQLTNVNFGVRPGQKVWVAWGGGTKRKTGSWLRVSNLTANTTTNLKNWRVWWNTEVYTRPFFPVYLRHFIAWVIILLAVVFAIQGPDRFERNFSNYLVYVGGAGALIPALISGLIAVGLRIKGQLASIEKQLQQAIDNLVSEEATAYSVAITASQNDQQQAELVS